jgi:hypothetical protein
MSYAWNPILNSIYMSNRTAKLYTRAGNTTNHARNICMPIRDHVHNILILHYPRDRLKDPELLTCMAMVGSQTNYFKTLNVTVQLPFQVSFGNKGFEH